MIKDVLGRLVEKPQYGGTVVISIDKDQVQFDPCLGSGSRSVFYTNEMLMRGDWAKGLTGSGETTWRYYNFPRADHMDGAIAESWELEGDTTLIYHIRKGVRWHDKYPANGRELVAEDVIWSESRLFGKDQCPRAYHANAYPWDKHIVSITAPDKYTLRVETVAGRTGVVWEKFGLYSYIQNPDAVEEWGNQSYWEQSLGTGPWMLDDFVPMASTTYKRNPNYWSDHPLYPGMQMPFPDYLKELVILDKSTQLAAMRSGKIDWLGGFATQSLSWEDAEMLTKTNPELKYMQMTSGANFGISYRVDKPELPIYNVKVRQALNMAIDNQTIADSYFGGKVSALYSYPVMKIPDLADARVPLAEQSEIVKKQFGYYPEEAKQILADEGYPNGFKIKVLCQAQASHTDLLAIAQDYWSKIGVELEIDAREYGVYHSIWQAKEYEMAYFDSLGGSIPFAFMYEFPGNTWNHSQINDPYILEVKEGVNERYWDPVAKYAYYKEKLGTYTLEQAFNFQFPSPDYYTFWQPWLKGYNGELSVGYYDTYNFPNWVWIDSKLKAEMTGR